ISYLRGYLYPEEGRRGVLIAYGAMGLATLAKGPIGFLLPGLIIVIFLLLRRDLTSLWRRGQLVLGIPLFLVITLPWYLAVGMETHWAWDQLFFDQQNVDRYTAAMQGHRGPIYYYLFTIALALLPWTIFLPQTLAELWQRRAALLQKAPADAFMLVWAIAWVAFFSLGATKLPNYVWEAYPALFVLIAARLYAALNETQPISRRGVILSLAALLLIGVALAVLGAWLVPEQIPPLGDVAYLGAPYIAAALLALMRVHQMKNLQELPRVVADGQGTAYLALPAHDIPAVRAQLSKALRVRELYSGYELYSRKHIALLRIQTSSHLENNAS
ncbi:MAG: dolichyl-phosphate-mannose--protein mannosyltransferase, partial [Acidithiobacillus ferrivorans]